MERRREQQASTEHPHAAHALEFEEQIYTVEVAHAEEVRILEHLPGEIVRQIVLTKLLKGVARGVEVAGDDVPEVGEIGGRRWKKVGWSGEGEIGGWKVISVEIRTSSPRASPRPAGTPAC